MKKPNRNHLSLALAMALMGGASTQSVLANSFTEALTTGTANADLRLRYEDVQQDNGAQDASALTLRTRLGYTTGSFKGFSGVVKMEDNRIALGQGDYTVGPTGYHSGIYSVIADPEFTELDQGFIQYKGAGFSAKLGRQVITMDNHRFVGHVGWRQDRQTFDGLSVQFSPVKDLTVKYAYINQRNRIFAEAADLNAKDHLFNAAYLTTIGTLTGYAYLLEVDNYTDNALDTYGIRFTGSATAGDTKIVYTAEFASQSSETATTDFDADYVMLQAGAVFGGVTAKVGYEALGTDNGAYGFSTPLATLHKFNGWADQFLGTPAQGLVDTTVTLAGKVAGGGWTAIYHDFEADEASDTVDDLGSELDLQYMRKYGKHYSAGIKYAAYSGASGRVDADKLWLWVGAKF
ncbi:MAG: hypothetical protein ACJA13_003831 [Paraglaciecola sp.]|jgi:hypothetical protein